MTVIWAALPGLDLLISLKTFSTLERVARSFGGQGRFLQIRAQISGSSESQS